MHSKGMWQDCNLSLGVSWFHSKWCSVALSIPLLQERGISAADVMCSGALFLCSVAAVRSGTGGDCFGWVSGQVSAPILCPNCCAADCVLGADPYVLIKCENQNVRSPVQHDTTSAVFDTQVIFYRKNIDSPITVQVREASQGHFYSSSRQAVT